jgi:hypothetical protein
MNKKFASRLKKIEKRTGLTFSKYQSPELAETAAEYIEFPVMIFGTLARSVFFCLGILTAAVVGLYFLSEGVGASLAFLVPGVLLTVPWVAFRFLRLLVLRMESDLTRMGELGFDTVRSAATDLRELAGRKSVESLPSARDLFEGIMLGSLIPTIESVVKTGVPLFGRAASAILSRMLAQIASGIGAAMEALQNTATDKLRNVASKVGKETPEPEASLKAGGDEAGDPAVWSSRIEAGLDAGASSLERIVDGTVGRTGRFLGRFEKFTAGCSAACWLLVWSLS